MYLEHRNFIGLPVSSIGSPENTVTFDVALGRSEGRLGGHPLGHVRYSGPVRRTKSLAEALTIYRTVIVTKLLWIVQPDGTLKVLWDSVNRAPATIKEARPSAASDEGGDIVPIVAAILKAFAIVASAPCFAAPQL